MNLKFNFKLKRYILKSIRLKLIQKLSIYCKMVKKKQEFTLYSNKSYFLNF